jgi:tRNA A-37 threonylcarbamoyl transferase component Bud32
MKAMMINGIRWFFGDEGLVDAVRDIAAPEGERRAYFTIAFGDRALFVKYFDEPGIAGAVRNKTFPRGKREYELGGRLRSLGVPTPEPVGYGLSRRGSFLVQERITGRSLATALSGPEGRGELLRRLALFLRILREAGVRHNDLHLDNILVAGPDRLVIIDLHTMRIKRTFTMADDLSNLSHALAMFYRELSEDELRSFFDTYGIPSIRPDVEREIGRMEVRWVKSKEKRAFQNTSRLVARDGFVFMAGRESMAPGELLKVLKEDRKVRVEQYSNHVRKTYRNGRRLKRAWRAHTVLAYMGMAVAPEPFFVKKASAASPGVIAMEDLTARGMELDRFLDGAFGTLPATAQKRFIRSLSAFFAAIAKRGIIHQDLKGCNVFVLDDGTFRLLDVEDVLFHPFEAPDLKRMAVQLNTTVPAFISARDRIRFFVVLGRLIRGDTKRLFAEVREASLRSEIVYEGVKGLVVESWGEERR